MSSVIQLAPRMGELDAAHLADREFGIQATAAPLPSERDRNFLCTTSAGERFVLKVANSAESEAQLELENQLIRHLAPRVLRLEFPRIVPSRTGKEIVPVEAVNQRHFARLLTWIDGACLATVPNHGATLLSSLGAALGAMDRALAGFDHPAAHRQFHWDLRSTVTARAHRNLLPEGRRDRVDRVFDLWEKIPWETLRHSVIHNDANDYNVLVQDGRVCAILDWGDVVHSATVCNLAVALAYVMLGKSDPVASAAQVVAGYHEVYPLTEAEVDALFPLAATRLAMSVCYAAFQSREAPANDYLNISNAAAWEFLERLPDISPEWPRRLFRYACGLPPRPELIVRDRDREQLVAQRQRRIGPSLSVSYRAPLHMVAGSRQYLYDAGGRRYLDCVNNVAHVGHSHPVVVRAAADQLAVLNTNTRYLYDQLTAYAERLTATLPEPLRVVFLVNSGSEANELALRMARTHTGRQDVIVVDAAYHGNTNALIELSPYKFDGPGGRGCPPHVHKTPLPDVYRGPHRGHDAGSEYAEYVAAASGRTGGVAAFFCESAPGCGGQIILPPGYLPAAYAAVRTAGGVCVADEVQTGFGRAGTHFWMFQPQGVVPDIVTMGKPIGNGYPLGAVVTTPEIAASFANGMEYFNTFGGSPVSCAVGLAVLDVIRDEELQQHALEAGNRLLAGLRELQTRHRMIGDARGTGLFIGIELVRDRETLEAADAEAQQAIEEMKDRGILLSTDGPLHNVIKIKPPLPFSNADADFVVAELDAVLRRWS